MLKKKKKSPWVLQWKKKKKTYLCSLTNSIVDNIMVLRDLLLGRKLEILQPQPNLLEVDIAQPPIKQHLTREQPELEPQLLVVNRRVAAQIEQGVVEVGQGLFEIAQQEVRHAFLEVGNGEVLVTTDGALVAFNLLVVSHSSVGF